MSEETYTLKQVASIANRNIVVVRNHVREGRLPAEKISRSYIVLKSDLDKYLEWTTATDAYLKKERA